MKNNETRSHRRWLWFSLVASASAVLLGRVFGEWFADSDIPYYIDIAKGNMAAVLQPYASRQLAPHVARWLAELCHTSVQWGFIVEQVISLVVLTAVLGWLLDAFDTELWMLIAIAGPSFWAQSFNGAGLPDLWYSALLVLFLVFLYRRSWLLASAMLLVLYVSRESTLLVLICFLIAGWREIRFQGRVVAVAASIVGMITTRSLIPPGTENREHFGPVAYMAGKVPWNFLKNVAGFAPWNNLNPGNCSTPRWTIAVPFGAMHMVGLCSYNPLLPLTTLRVALSSFGLLPLLLVYVWIRRSTAFSLDSVVLRFTLIYGVASFLLAPELGSSVSRLFSYAWPLFFVALPLMLSGEGIRPLSSTAAKFVGLHVAVSWSAALRPGGFSEVSFNLIMIGTICVANVAGWFLLSRGLNRNLPRGTADDPPIPG